MQFKIDLQNSKHLQASVVTIGFVILIFKFIAYSITSSNAILTDAVESIVNVFAGVFTLLSLIISTRPKDKSHPYGHGKIEFISAGMEGTLIFIAGALMIIKSTYNFFTINELEHLDQGIYITAFSGFLNYMMGYALIKLGKKDKSIALISSGEHLKSDAYTTVGMLLGLTVVFFTSILLLDNVIAIIFGGLLLYTGYSIMRTALSGIMDEADDSLLSEVITYLNLNRKNTWIDFHNLRIIKYGSNIHIDSHISVPRYLTVEETHSEITDIEDLIKEKYNEKVEIFLHPDPCKDLACSLCNVKNCPIRKVDFQKQIEWNLENVLENKSHRLDN
jgi:cation diffusion facilitator family transporter